MPVRQTKELVTVGADPYIERNRQMEVFGRDLNEAGVLPIQIFLQNLGDGQLWIQRVEVALELPDGSRVSPTRATVADKYKTPEPVEEEPATSGGSVLGALALIFILPLLLSPPGQAVGNVGAAFSREAGERQTEDYWNKELKDTILEKGASVHGFVYFILPGAVQFSTEATLVLPVIDLDKATRLTFRLPLRFQSTSD
jgi:hypothetical protein